MDINQRKTLYHQNVASSRSFIPPDNEPPDYDPRSTKELLPNSCPIFKKLKISEDKSNVVDKSSECAICFENIKNATFVHGNSGHTCCCYDCAIKVEQSDRLCPICRVPISMVIRNFM